MRQFAKQVAFGHRKSREVLARWMSLLFVRPRSDVGAPRRPVAEAQWVNGGYLGPWQQ